MDDLISRKQAIDAFNPDHHVDWYTPWIVQTLEELPSVPRNGKWIYKGDFTWKCSECDDSFILLGDGTPNDKGCNFCWRCGADMRGDNNDS